ncbi:HKD family nuclease [Thalassobacillus devorans]|uniref:phospholipase D family protein n=1 Tax=Thalassobacillus devorans TaxID=279813 RepID=UPI00078187F5|nr:phospholipase D family protein [Thalassobacillus devorans]NIK27634.1 HKD family nuclease [Thalassobacillus devorans]
MKNKLNQIKITFKQLLKKKRSWVFLAVVLWVAVVIFYNTSYKALPVGLSYQGNVHDMENIEFYRDLTYQNKTGKTVHELEIFEEINAMIAEAEEFIVIDMFLFNGYTDGNHDFPEISKELADAIIKQKEKHPHLKAVFITDQVNTVYNSYQPEAIKRLRKNDVDVVMTSLSELRDSNPLYSSVYRTFFQWFGEEGNGWIGNPMAKEAPDITFRSYVKMMNIKANHRKVVVTEDAAMVSTANPHDASGYHENVAFKMKGPIQKDILKAEKAVVDYSSEGEVDYPDIDSYSFEEQTGSINAQFLTERKIYNAILADLEKVRKNDTVWLGMYYLADRKVLERLKNAAENGATINIILDPNKTAFGNTKTGLPNLPVAAELMNLENNNLNIRWYNVDKEQFHTKMLYIDKVEGDDTIIAGSANYTRRNLSNLNLEADVRIQAPEEEQVIQEVSDYFNRIWNNQDGEYTVAYEENESELTFLLSLTYRLQKLIWFTTY